MTFTDRSVNAHDDKVDKMRDDQRVQRFKKARLELKKLFNAGLEKKSDGQLTETEECVFFALASSLKGKRFTGFGVYFKKHNEYGFWLKEREAPDPTIRFYKCDALFSNAVEL